MYSGSGKHGQGTSSFRFSKRTSSTIADAGLKISTAALALTFAVMLLANVAPTATWLWAFEPRWNEPDRSIILALHGLTW